MTLPTKPLRTIGRCAPWLAALLLATLAQAQSTPGISDAPGAASVPSAAVTTLNFADFYQRPYSSKGLKMTPALLQADGQRVHLTGYMVQQEHPPLGRFMLTPRPVQMSEHADGDADDLPAAWVMVYLDASQQDYAIPHERGLREVTGVLSVGRHEEEDGRVSWVRLHLDPAATRAMTAPEVAEFLQTQHHH